MLRTLSIALCGVAITLQGSLATRGADTKAPEIKEGIAGKIVKIDVEKGMLTIAREDGRERTLYVETHYVNRSDGDGCGKACGA
jgi:hypothetical protein